MTRRRLLGLAVAGTGIAATVPARAALPELFCPPAVGPLGNPRSETQNTLLAQEFDPPKPARTLADPPRYGPNTRRLVMTNWHTGDRYDRPFVENGAYIPEAIDEFSQFMRDWREHVTKEVDIDVLEIVYNVWKLLDTDKAFNLNSGYRTPKTNAMLPGAVPNSYHLKCMACDLTLPGRSVEQVYKAAAGLNAGGVGKYPQDGFVHVDCGPVRYW